MPYISCITTIYNDQESVRVSIESILNQSFEDFELIIVDDGADELTRKVVGEYTDKRIKYIRQYNDGLSSARNRGLKHCSGEFICFLDADDMRPMWAFEKMAEAAQKTNPDCVFMKGKLVELRNETLDFYDNLVFDKLVEMNYKDNFDKLLPLLMLIEPQSANKLVKKSFLEQNNLIFPNGLFFEDILFHMGIVARLKSYEIIDDPMFTYFRRYGKQQITSTATTTRFDAISTGFMTLEAFALSPRFQNPLMRTALLLAVFKLIKWSEETVSHRLKYYFREVLKKKLYKLKNNHELYFINLEKIIEDPMFDNIESKYDIVEYNKK